MASVSLINYTGFGHPDPLFAGRMLAYTKNTRMNMTPSGFWDFMKKPEGDIIEELKYMATSIPSSWEFIDVTFSITNVSRAIAQQITRTRTASYAMQSQRVTNMESVTWDSNGQLADNLMSDAIDGYKQAIASGMSLEDARDLLPIGVHCNLLAKYNFRNWVELVTARDSLRVQGPYRSIVAQMKAEVLTAWPWATHFLKKKNDTAISLIEEVANEIALLQGDKGAMYKGLSGKLAKAADLIKKGE